MFPRKIRKQIQIFTLNRGVRTEQRNRECSGERKTIKIFKLCIFINVQCSITNFAPVCACYLFPFAFDHMVKWAVSQDVHQDIFIDHSLHVWGVFLSQGIYCNNKHNLKPSRNIHFSRTVYFECPPFVDFSVLFILARLVIMSCSQPLDRVVTLDRFLLAQQIHLVFSHNTSLVLCCHLFVVQLMLSKFFK